MADSITSRECHDAEIINILAFTQYFCGHCKQKFCPEHCKYTTHNCHGCDCTTVLGTISHRPTFLCPLCAKSLELTAGADQNAALEAHIVKV